MHLLAVEHCDGENWLVSLKRKPIRFGIAQYLCIFNIFFTLFDTNQIMISPKGCLFRTLK